MGEPQTMSAARFVDILEILFPMFYMAKRTIRKQSAEIEWSSVDSITDDRNTDVSGSERNETTNEGTER